MRFRFLFALFLASLNAVSQTTFEFDEGFYLAKDVLAKGHMKRALPMFEKLHQLDPANANMRYLLGVCHLLDSIPDTVAVPYLESGIPFIHLDYNPGSPQEKNTPIFVYFYLSLAYSVTNRCENALQSFKKFQSLYGIFKEDYYILEAKNWIDSCARNNPAVKTIPADYHKIGTKEVAFTTPAPLWGVQVGAYSRFIPLWEFDNLKNVDAYMDRSGMIRYVIGHFSLRSQAETLKKIVLNKGYKDAFIVDVNHESRYTEEVITVDEQSIKKPLQGRIDYRVQIGAFRDSIPISLVELYMKIDGIKEFREGDLTLMTAGKFTNYDEAKTHRDNLANAGVPDPFVAALNEGRKVPLKQAISYTKKKEEAKKKKKKKKE